MVPLLRPAMPPTWVALSSFCASVCKELTLLEPRACNTMAGTAQFCTVPLLTPAMPPMVLPSLLAAPQAKSPSALALARPSVP